MTEAKSFRLSTAPTQTFNLKNISLSFFVKKIIIVVLEKLHRRAVKGGLKRFRFTVYIPEFNYRIFITFVILDT